MDAAAFESVIAPYGAWPSIWPDSWRAPGGVYRADVFDVAGMWRAGGADARELLGAVLVWGHGSNNYAHWRSLNTLDTPDLDRRLTVLEPLLDDAVDLEGLVEVYRGLGNRQRSRLDWFGASFFTKLLYFAGYRHGRGGPQPLILDSRVASLLPAELGVRRPRHHYVPPWTSTEWRAYIEWACERAAGGEPELVELALFTGSGVPEPGTG